MPSPFCNSCGATVAEGTRFCVKCGQPMGQTQTAPPPPPPPPSLAATVPVLTPHVPPPPPMVVEPPKEGSSAALWLGLIGVLLLACAGGLWYFVSRGPTFAGTSAVATTSTTATVPSVQPTAPPTKPEEIPPNPDFAKKAEEPPPNPDFAKKPAPSAPTVRTTEPTRRAVHDPGPTPREQPSPPVTPAARTSNPTSGRLHANVEVGLNGEVVFENLPAARLRFIYDHSAWRPTISHQANGTQTLVMRSLKAGIQRTCDVTWEIVE